MNIAGTFTKKILTRPELAQLEFRVEVLDKYLADKNFSVSRTNSVGRIKSATWSVDFGIAPDEQFLHTSVALFTQKLPEAEQAHWLEFVADDRYAANFLKMQSAHSCVDDGTYRGWGEEVEEALF